MFKKNLISSLVLGCMVVSSLAIGASIAEFSKNNMKEAK